MVTQTSEACAYLVHERDDLKDQLVLPQVVAVFEDDGVHGSVLGLEDQLGRHQRALKNHPRSSRSRIKSNGPFGRTPSVTLKRVAVSGTMPVI